ncbi:DUF6441 family protein [Roseomonas populi]|uniref:DUF6441 family protein n=1 Tax=Roseomonas populi TaxID=3121582 RepID=A0ABT1X109_9PROT|nr:DUF6441 family protein [Roseomonas pecuniae]MCR0981788.1 DUF6441 family protein [Roseomonas pecuniae]
MPAIRLTTSGVRIPDLLTKYREQANQVVQSAVEVGTAGMLQDFRSNLAAAFPRSKRAANLVTSRVFPEREVSINAAGSVVGRGGKGSAWPAPLKLFAEGGTIYPTKAGTALAVPTARVPMVSRRKMTPDEVSRSFGERLTLVPARGGVWGYLVLKKQTVGRSGQVRRATKRRAAQGRGAESIVMFVLIPRATIRKRLDFDTIAQKWANTMPQLLEQQAARITEGGRS